MTMIPKSQAVRILFLIMVVGDTIGFSAPSKEDTPPDVSGDLVYPGLRTYAEALHFLMSKSFRPVDANRALESSIRGMVQGDTDKHSAYLSREELAELEGATSGQFWGLGIEVALENGDIQVIAPIEGGPAYRAGIRSGDKIRKINDHPVKAMSLVEVRRQLRGHRGTEVALTIVRGLQEMLIKIVRDEVKVVGVQSYWTSDDIVAIKVTQFQRGTAQLIRNAITGSPIKKNTQGILLVLTDNPGGIYEEAVQLIDLFLEKGIIVYTIDRNGTKKVEEASRPHTVAGDTPLVILTNKGTASASEIVIGAMQDTDRAIIVGDNTYGKGSVQSVFPLSNGGALKLTIGEYYTPLGHSIEREGGIKPDVKVKMPEHGIDRALSFEERIKDPSKDILVKEGIRILQKIIDHKRVTKAALPTVIALMKKQKDL